LKGLGSILPAEAHPDELI